MNAVVDFNKVRNLKMAQPEVRDDNIFFPVEQVDLAELTGMEDTGLSAIVRKDNNTILKVHSQKYELTPNEVVFDALDRMIRNNTQLKTDGMTIIDRVAYAGGRTVRQYTFPEHQIETRRGDFTQLRLTSMNSYDGSTNLNVKFGGYRLLCLNGMESGDFFGQFKARHTSMFNPEEMDRYLSNAVNNFYTIGKVWRSWLDTYVSDVQVAEFLKVFTKGSDKLAAKLMNFYIAERRSMGPNLWSLFNALTFWSTHEEVKSSSQGNKPYIVQQREARVGRALLSPLFREAA